MFGLFGKRKGPAEAAIEVMDDTIFIAAEKWLHFCRTIPFKQDVPLADRIAAFAFPFMEGARQNVPALREAPDAFLMLIVAKGVEKSGTHARAEIEEALGVTLPD